MTPIYLSLGSNVDRHHNILAALDALADLFGQLRISSVYESKSVGFDGSNFFNLVVGADVPYVPEVAVVAARFGQLDDLIRGLPMLGKAENRAEAEEHHEEPGRCCEEAHRSSDQGLFIQTHIATPCLFSHFCFLLR